MISFELNKGGRQIKIENVLKKLEKIIFKEFKKNGVISVAFVNGAKMKEYNAKYRHKKKSTDILTFILNPGRSGMFCGDRSRASGGAACNGINDGEILGEIILSLADIKKHAKVAGKGLKEMVIYLIVHGICHIFGHTHQKKDDMKYMEKRECKILNYVYKTVI